MRVTFFNNISGLETRFSFNSSSGPYIQLCILSCSIKKKKKRGEEEKRKKKKKKKRGINTGCRYR